ncbi:unnamed protein product [Rhizophagus irregularis]|nr:unnamed protein product [Rhizophagus irregularis]
MSKQFFPSLSQNYIEILTNDEYYDITIESFGFQQKNVDNGLFKLPNISPEIFWIILTYIYGGIISLNEQEPSEILKILSAADELHLQELTDYLQEYLIEDKFEWMEQHFKLTHRTSFKSNSLLRLQKFCTDLMAKSPKKVFKSFDFTSLPEKSLVLLISRDDLQMKEVEIWNIKPNDNILLPRYRNIDGIIDSSIVNLNIVSLVSRWIDKIDINSKFSYTREFYLQYKF